MKEAQFCFTHNPDTKQEKHLAVVKGGLASRKVHLDLEPRQVTTPQEVIELMQDTINGVREGEIPPNIANTVGYLAGLSLKAMEVAKVEEKVDIINSILNSRKQAKRSNYG